MRKSGGLYSLLLMSLASLDIVTYSKEIHETLSQICDRFDRRVCRDGTCPCPDENQPRAFGMTMGQECDQILSSTPAIRFAGYTWGTASSHSIVGWATGTENVEVFYVAFEADQVLKKYSSCC